MKILLITDEVWDEKLYTNSVLTNWFTGFPAEFANIYLAGGIPDNNCCKKYFQVTDKMMFVSIIAKKKAGISFTLDEEGDNKQSNINKNSNIEMLISKVPNNKKSINNRIFQGKSSVPEKESYGLYSFLKSISMESLRLLKDFIWLKGKYNVAGLTAFIQEFQPDILFCLRYASRKVLRFERLIAGITDTPLLIFTGDDEYTLKQLRLSPIYWYRRIMLRKDLRKNMEIYSKYYMLSAAQADFYKNNFTLETSVLMKCGTFSDIFTEKPVNKPIKIIYAGRLYCNRWKTLILIKKALERMNKNKIRMILEIYTKDKLSSYQKKMLDDGHNSMIKPPVTAEELKNIYKNADIALHVEAFDLKNRLLTKYSFSTKIIDCLASSCAVLAVCPKAHPGYRYLKENDGAFCLNHPEEIYPVLKDIYCHKEKLLKYQEKAWSLGLKNHQKSKVQEFLLKDFVRIMNQERQAVVHESITD